MTKEKKERRMPKYPPKPKHGRSPEITEAIIDKIKNAILVGNYFETACAMAGIHPDTAYHWLKRGAQSRRKGDEDCIFAIFSEIVEKAQGDAEGRDVMVIEMTAHGAPAQHDPKTGKKVREEVKRDWKAAAWRLERKHPKRWGRFERHEHSGPDGKAVPVTFTELIVQLSAESPDKEDGEDD